MSCLCSFLKGGLILIRGLPLITYAPIGGGGGQASYTFLLRTTCKKKGGGGGGPLSM